MGSARDVVEISSDEEEGSPVARRRRKLPAVAPLACVAKLFANRLVIGKSLAVVPPQMEKEKSGGAGVGGDDDVDDCVVLDSDPYGLVTVADEKGRSAGDGSSDELVIVAEKGKVACRDFPHSRHSCSNLPFSTTSHVKHCSMCYCFVCDAPAPCNYWGKGLLIDDHCHATDKETKWKILRLEIRGKSLAASRPESHQNLVHPTTTSPRQQDTQCQVSVAQSHPSSISNISRSSVARQNPLPSVARHAAVRATTNAARTVSTLGPSSATRARSYTPECSHRSNYPPNPTEPYQQEEELYPPEDYYGEYNEPYQQEEDELYPPEDYYGGYNEPYQKEEDGLYPPEDYYGEYNEPHLPEDYYEEYSEPPKEAKLYVGNLPYDVDSEYLAQLFKFAGIVDDSKIIYNRETNRSRGYGFVTMSTVEEAEKAVKIFHHSDLDGRCMIVNRRGARAETPPCQSGSSSFRIFVCNLPWKVDDSWLEELFSEYGEVVDARVVCYYRRKTRRSRGYGFVTMVTRNGSDYAIAALNKQVLEGRTLQVKVAKEQQPR